MNLVIKKLVNIYNDNYCHHCIIVFLSNSLFLEQKIIAEVVDDTYYYYKDDYVKDFEDEYFYKNQVKINEINKMRFHNIGIIAKQDLDKENFPDGFSNRELMCEKNLFFILSFYQFFKKLN